VKGQKSSSEYSIDKSSGLEISRISYFKLSVAGES
jgi:hypothetical protein